MFEFPAIDILASKNKTSLRGSSLLRYGTHRSGIFKHLKFSENDKFVETNNVDSILVGPSGSSGVKKV